MQEKLPSPASSENESKETRRKFLMRPLAAAATAKRIEAQEPVSELEGTVRRSLIDLVRVKRERIDFPEQGDAMPAPVRAILGNLIALQNAIERAAQEKTDILAISNAEDPLRRSIWESLRPFIPEASGPFSNEALNHVLAYRLPSLVAKYNVIADTRFRFLESEQGVPLSPGDAFMSFFHIERKEPETVTRWGRTFERNTLWLDSVFDTGVLPVNPDIRPGGAFMKYGNAFIYRPLLEQTVQTAIQKMQEFSALDALGDEELVRHFQNAGSGGDAILDAVFAKLLRTVSKRGRIREQFEEEYKEHETRHILDHLTGSVADHFPMSEGMTLTELKRIDMNQVIHEEVNGNLSYLRYARSKSTGLIGMMNGSRNTGAPGDLWHNQANRWTIDALVGEILRERSRLYIAIEKRKKMPPRDQALFALADMVEEDPDGVANLAARMMAFHEQHYDEDVSTAYGMKNTAYPSSVILVSPEELRNIGIGALAAGGAAWALHKLRQRKKEVAKKEKGSKKK